MSQYTFAFRVLCVLVTCILAVILIIVILTTMPVLFENNPGCYRTLYGCLVLTYLITIFVMMGCSGLSMCCAAIMWPPHREEEWIDP